LAELVPEAQEAALAPPALLANAAWTPEQIKAITGHKMPLEIARNTRTADQERKSRQTITNLLRSEN
jgi:hypothetical protein